MKDIIEQRLNQANGRLKAGNFRISISLRGDFLSLRATLPPKPGSPHQHPHQQRISLGISATIDGITQAEKEARKLRARLDAGEFMWDVPVPVVKEPSLDEWVSRFEEDYFFKRPRTPQTLTTWEGDYLKSFKKIESTTLSKEAILNAIQKTIPDTRTRQRTTVALAALARFAGVEVDLSGLGGSYSPSKVKPRDLPSDEQIAEWYDRITDPGWQWFYGMLAAYGLRPHEAFHVLEFDGPIVEIGQNTKTGSRFVWPFYPEWFSIWNLSIIDLPPIVHTRNTEIGNKAGYYFRRKLRLPFPLYALRHCWARRTLEFGLDISFAAQQMGHSVSLHSKTYHAWIGKNAHGKAYELLLMKEGRPRPPLDHPGCSSPYVK